MKRFGLRRGASFGLALALLVVSLTVVVFPAVKPDKLGILGFLLFLALLLVGRGMLWQKPRALVWLLLVVSLLTYPFVIIAHGFGGVDMMAFLFHMEFGVAGAGLEELHNEILTATLALVWVIFATWGLSTLSGRKLWPYLAVSGVVLAAHPLVLYGLSAARGSVVHSDLAERLQLAPAWNGRTPEADVLVMYLEGLDHIYFEPEHYGDTMEALAAYKPEALNLTAVRQIEATGWSMAGVVASQCGVPLLPNGFRARNNFHGVEDYLGHHRCLGDVMKDAGFTLEFVMGGDMEFAGYGTFLNQHGFSRALGLKHFEQNYPRALLKDANINWVLDDQLVYEEALKRHEALLEAGGRYGLFVETITTHGDVAYASRECSEDGRAGQTRDVARVARCFAEQTVRFIEEIKRRQGVRPLKIVILSDHLAHDERFKEKLPLETRANLVMLLDGERRGTVLKEGSMIDVYPTLLDWLKLAPEGGDTRAGLGVSLLSEQPTLVEEKGLHPLNRELYINPELGKAIWRDDSWARR